MRSSGVGPTTPVTLRKLITAACRRNNGDFPDPCNACTHIFLYHTTQRYAIRMRNQMPPRKTGEGKDALAVYYDKQSPLILLCIPCLYARPRVHSAAACPGPARLCPGTCAHVRGLQVIAAARGIPRPFSSAYGTRRTGGTII